MNFRLKTIAVLLLVSFAFEQLSMAAEIKAQAVDLFESQKADLGFKLPESIGTVEDSWRAPGSQKTVILIQDAHTNRSGQLNLSKTLDLLLQKNKDLKYIFAEAAVDDNSLSFLRASSDPAVRKRVADSYLRKGLLHGAEYLDLTSDREFMIWGVEDIGLYMKSLESYRAVVKERERFQNYLKRIGRTIKTLEPRIYNPALLAFEETRSKFQSEEISLTDYFEVLTREAEKNRVQLSFYPHLAALKTLKEKEDAIDFKSANEEQANAVRSLSAADQKELNELSENEKAPFKLSSQAHEERKGFYAFLEEKLDGRLQDHPELAKYFEYLRASKKIDPAQILNEQKAMEGEVLSVLAKTRDEKTLLQCRANLELFKKLFDLSLTPAEYRQYKEASQDLTITRLTGFLNKKIMDLGTYYERAMFLEEGYEDIVRTSEEFYELTKDRDEAFLRNMFSKMEKESQKKAVLITGGFHSPSLKNLLKEKNISFISITPQVTHETNQKRYEEILLSRTVNPALIPASYNDSNMKMDIVYLRTAASVEGFFKELSPKTPTQTANFYVHLSTSQDTQGARLSKALEIGKNYLIGLWRKWRGPDLKSEFIKYGIQVENGKVNFDKVPLNVPWVMDEIRPVERRPVSSYLEDAPSVTSLFPIERLPSVGYGGSNDGILLTIIRETDGSEYPAIIKLISKNVDDEIYIATLYDRAGVSPRVYGLIKSDDKKVIGYAMQIVIGREVHHMEDGLDNKAISDQLKRDIGKFPAPSNLMQSKRSGKLIGIDAGYAAKHRHEAGYVEEFERFAEYLNSGARLAIKSNVSLDFEDERTVFHNPLGGQKIILVPLEGLSEEGEDELDSMFDDARENSGSIHEKGQFYLIGGAREGLLALARRVSLPTLPVQDELLDAAKEGVESAGLSTGKDVNGFITTFETISLSSSWTSSLGMLIRSGIVAHEGEAVQWEGVSPENFDGINVAKKGDSTIYDIDIYLSGARLADRSKKSKKIKKRVLGNRESVSDLYNHALGMLRGLKNDPVSYGEVVEALRAIKSAKGSAVLSPLDSAMEANWRMYLGVFLLYYSQDKEPDEKLKIYEEMRARLEEAESIMTKNNPLRFNPDPQINQKADQLVRYTVRTYLLEALSLLGPERIPDYEERVITLSKKLFRQVSENPKLESNHTDTFKAARITYLEALKHKKDFSAQDLIEMITFSGDLLSDLEAERKPDDKTFETILTYHLFSLFDLISHMPLFAPQILAEITKQIKERNFDPEKMILDIGSFTQTVQALTDFLKEAEIGDPKNITAFFNKVGPRDVNDPTVLLLKVHSLLSDHFSRNTIGSGSEISRPLRTLARQMFFDLKKKAEDSGKKPLYLASFLAGYVEKDADADKIWSQYLQKETESLHRDAIQDLRDAHALMPYISRRYTYLRARSEESAVKFIGPFIGELNWHESKHLARLLVATLEDIGSYQMIQARFFDLTDKKDLGPYANQTIYLLARALSLKHKNTSLEDPKMPLYEEALDLFADLANYPQLRQIEKDFFQLRGASKSDVNISAGRINRFSADLKKTGERSVARMVFLIRRVGDFKGTDATKVIFRSELKKGLEKGYLKDHPELEERAENVLIAESGARLAGRSIAALEAKRLWNADDLEDYIRLVSPIIELTTLETPEDRRGYIFHESSGLSIQKIVFRGNTEKIEVAFFVNSDGSVHHIEMRRYPSGVLSRGPSSQQFQAGTYSTRGLKGRLERILGFAKAARVIRRYSRDEFALLLKNDSVHPGDTVKINFTDRTPSKKLKIVRIHDQENTMALVVRGLRQDESDDVVSLDRIMEVEWYPANGARLSGHKETAIETAVEEMARSIVRADNQIRLLDHETIAMIVKRLKLKNITVPSANVRSIIARMMRDAGSSEPDAAPKMAGRQTPMETQSGRHSMGSDLYIERLIEEKAVDPLNLVVELGIGNQSKEGEAPAPTFAELNARLLEHNPQLKLVGVDISPTAVNKMKEFIANEQKTGWWSAYTLYDEEKKNGERVSMFENTRIVEGGFEKPAELYPGQVDLIRMANLSWYYNADERKEARELLTRALRPGGVFLEVLHTAMVAFKKTEDGALVPFELTYRYGDLSGDRTLDSLKKNTINNLYKFGLDKRSLDALVKDLAATEEEYSFIFGGSTEEAAVYLNEHLGYSAKVKIFDSITLSLDENGAAIKNGSVSPSKNGARLANKGKLEKFNSGESGESVAIRRKGQIDNRIYLTLIKADEETASIVFETAESTAKIELKIGEPKSFADPSRPDEEFQALFEYGDYWDRSNAYIRIKTPNNFKIERVSRRPVDDATDESSQTDDHVAETESDMKVRSGTIMWGGARERLQILDLASDEHIHGLVLLRNPEFKDQSEFAIGRSLVSDRDKAWLRFKIMGIVDGNAHLRVIGDGGKTQDLYLKSDEKLKVGKHILIDMDGPPSELAQARLIHPNDIWFRISAPKIYRIIRPDQSQEYDEIVRRESSVAGALVRAAADLEKALHVYFINDIPSEAERSAEGTFFGEVRSSLLRIRGILNRDLPIYEDHLTNIMKEWAERLKDMESRWDAWFENSQEYSTERDRYPHISDALQNVKTAISHILGVRLSDSSKEEALRGLFADLAVILDENISQFRRQNAGQEFPSTRLQQEEFFDKVKPLIEEWVAKNLKDSESGGMKLLEENLGYPEGYEEYHRNAAAHSELGIGIYAHIWKAGGKTAIHNHGGILGIPVPLAPGIRETAYRMKTDPGKPYQDKLIEMEVIGNTEMPAYQAAAVTRGPGIHEVQNTSDKPVIVLEIYFGHFDTILNPIPVEGQTDVNGGNYLFTEQNPADLPVPLSQRLKNDFLIEVPREEFKRWAATALDDEFRIFTTEGTVIVSREQAERYLEEKDPKILMTRHQIIYMEPSIGARLAHNGSQQQIDRLKLKVQPSAFRISEDSAIKTKYKRDVLSGFGNIALKTIRNPGEDNRSIRIFYKFKGRPTVGVDISSNVHGMRLDMPRTQRMILDVLAKDLDSNKNILESPRDPKSWGETLRRFTDEALGIPSGARLAHEVVISEDGTFERKDKGIIIVIEDHPAFVAFYEMLFSNQEFLREMGSPYQFVITGDMESAETAIKLAIGDGKEQKNLLRLVITDNSFPPSPKARTKSLAVEVVKKAHQEWNAPVIVSSTSPKEDIFPEEILDIPVPDSYITKDKLSSTLESLMVELLQKGARLSGTLNIELPKALQEFTQKRYMYIKALDEIGQGTDLEKIISDFKTKEEEAVGGLTLHLHDLSNLPDLSGLERWSSYWEALTDYVRKSELRFNELPVDKIGKLESSSSSISVSQLILLINIMGKALDNDRINKLALDLTGQEVDPRARKLYTDLQTALKKAETSGILQEVYGITIQIPRKMLLNEYLPSIEPHRIVSVVEQALDEYRDPKDRLSVTSEKTSTNYLRLMILPPDDPGPNKRLDEETQEGAEKPLVKAVSSGSRLTEKDTTDISETAAEDILSAFRTYYASFHGFAERAPKIFANRDWTARMREDEERVMLYRHDLDFVYEELQGLLGGDLLNKEIWQQVHRSFEKKVRGSRDEYPAKAFFDSLLRKILGADAEPYEFEIHHAESVLEPVTTSDTYRSFAADGKSADELIRTVLQHYELPSAPYRNFEASANFASLKVQRFLAKQQYRLIEIQMINEPLIRNKKIYLMGRMRVDFIGKETGHLIYLPLVISLRHFNPDAQSGVSGGLVIHKVRMEPKEVAEIVTSTRASFITKIIDYDELVDFIQSLLTPSKRGESYRSILYTSIGYYNLAKRYLYQEIRSILSRGRLFKTAEMSTGEALSETETVMVIEKFPYVFKVIKNPEMMTESFSPDQVLENNRRMRLIDRAGRWVDTMTYENIREPISSFDPRLLEYLLKQNSNNIKIVNGFVEIAHMLVQRKVTPLDDYINRRAAKKNDEALRDVLLDFGQCLKDLAKTGFRMNNPQMNKFGVTSYGRIVLHDPNYLVPLDGDFEGKDLFMKQIPEPYKDIFLAEHGDLFSEQFWIQMRERHNRGEVLDIEDEEADGPSEPTKGKIGERAQSLLHTYQLVPDDEMKQIRARVDSSRVLYLPEIMLRDENGLRFYVKKRQGVMGYHQGDGTSEARAVLEGLDLSPPHPDKNSPKREMLAYLIGRGRVNVAEVRLLETSEVSNVPALRNLSAKQLKSYHLTRYVEDTRESELAQYDLGKANAAILVFDALIRKYDHHRFNKAYTFGVPVVFDNDVAFSEKQFVKKFNFFLKRYLQHVAPVPVDTEDDEAMEKRRKEIMETYPQDQIDKSIREFRALNFRELAQAAGYEGDELEKIVDYLKDTSEDLKIDTEDMLDSFLYHGARLAKASSDVSDDLMSFIDQTLKEVKDYPLELLIPKKKDQNALLKKIRDAMIRFDRKLFIRSKESYLDMPLPIGHDQTISQPSLVALELFALNLQKGEKVLEVGGGSGWMAALMSDFVGSEGRIYAVERVPQLVRRTKDRFKRLGIKNIQVIQAGEELGHPKEAPYDVILVSAGAPHIPEVLIDQLAENGRMIIPIFDEEAENPEYPYQLTYFKKIMNEEGDYNLVGGTLLPTTSWVDLVGKGAWAEWGPLMINGESIEVPDNLNMSNRMLINELISALGYEPAQIEKFEVLLGNRKYVEHQKNGQGHFGRAEWDPTSNKGIRISTNAADGARLAAQINPLEGKADLVVLTHPSQADRYERSYRLFSEQIEKRIKLEIAPGDDEFFEVRPSKLGELVPPDDPGNAAIFMGGSVTSCVLRSVHNVAKQALKKHQTFTAYFPSESLWYLGNESFEDEIVKREHNDQRISDFLKKTMGNNIIQVFNIEEDDAANIYLNKNWADVSIVFRMGNREYTVQTPTRPTSRLVIEIVRPAASGSRLAELTGEAVKEKIVNTLLREDKNWTADIQIDYFDIGDARRNPGTIINDIEDVQERLRVLEGSKKYILVVEESKLGSEPHYKFTIKLAGARLAPEDQPGARSSELGETNFMDGAANFLFQVRAAHAQEAKIGARLSVEVSPKETFIFKYFEKEGKPYAQAEGDPELVIALEEGRGQNSKETISLQEARHMEDLLEMSVDGDLEGAKVDADKTVIIRVPLNILPQDNYFESYAKSALAAFKAVQNRQSGGKIYFRLSEGDAQRVSALEEVQGINFLRPEETIPGASEVELVTENFAQGGRLSIPVQALQAGDVPALEAILKIAISAARTEPANLSDGFISAWRTVSGHSDIDGARLSNILTGQNITIHEALEFALKPITKIDLNEIVRYLNLGARMAAQAA